MYTVKFNKIIAKPDPDYGFPCSRSSHGFSCVSFCGRTLLVLIGGEHVARTPLDSNQMVWIAEKYDGCWTWKNVRFAEDEPVPPLRVAHSQAAVADCVYIFGGRSGVEMGENAMNDLWRFHVPTFTWELIQCNESQLIPEARSFHRMVAVNYEYPTGNKASLFIFGGCGLSGRLNDLHEFKLETETWKSQGSSSLLAGKGGANMLVFKTNHSSEPYIAIVAGFQGQESNDGHLCYGSLSAVETDPTWTWDDTKMKGLDGLRPRSVCVSASSHDNLGVIFGGEVNPSDRGHEGAGGFARDLVLLDGSNCGAILQTIDCPSTYHGEWPQARGWSDGDMLVSRNGAIFYFFGGLSGDDANPTRLDDFWQCEIDRVQ